MTKEENSIKTELAKYIVSQPSTKGMLTINMQIFLPRRSWRNPENTLLIGWIMKMSPPKN